VTFNATGIAGAAKNLAVSSGDSQSGVAGSQLTNALVVLVTDTNNNPVSGTTVSWAKATGNGSVSAPSSVSNASGFASVNATLGTTAGSNTYTATATGLTGSPLTFTATGTQAPNLTGSAAALIVGGTRTGQILITGGTNSGVAAGAVLNTWFYDPATSAITAGPSLAVKRAFHTATAIGTSGQVVIAGGPSGSAGEFELCSTTNTASCTVVGGAAGGARCNAAAAAIGTKVLITGGDNCANTTALQTWDLWDSVSSGSITSSVPGGGGNQLTVARRLHTATSVNGTVLLAGGDTASKTADIFTFGAPSTVAAATGLMLTVRQGHTATLLPAANAAICPTGPCVLIAGGVIFGTSPTGISWEVYDSNTKTFPKHSTGTTDLTVPGRTFHAAAVFTNGKVLLAGGDDATGASATSSPTNTTEFFDPTSATPGFTSGIALQVAREGMGSAFAPSQNVLAVSGGTGTFPSVEQIVTP
jgi:hypothetical protein